MLRKPLLSYIQVYKCFPKSSLLKCNNTNCQEMLIFSKYIASNNRTVKSLAANKPLEDPQAVEKEFLVRVKDDPDTFGVRHVTEQYDSDDVKEEEFLKNKPLPSSKLRTKQYADMIKELLRKRKIKEAIDILEVRMLKEDRVKPEAYIYSLLIGACGRVGYTKKAFSLFNQLKKRGLKVHPGMYTALFNACANSPWPETDGLSRATHLRNLIIEKLYEPNDSNYNAMIKAFGHCGDLVTAFEIADEMSAKKFPIKADTLNFLLQACITDKEAGFRHALLVWRKFIEKNISPNVFTFNLMLRCIRDCSLGDVETTRDVIERLTGEKQAEYGQQLLESSRDTDKSLSSSCNSENEKTNLSVHEKNTSENVKINSDNNLLENIKPDSSESTCLPFTTLRENRPNLMAKTPHLGNIIAISEVKTAQDRLLLVGGLLGFLENMVQNSCTPNIITFTQLLHNIPSTLAAEKELLQNLRKYNVKPDVDFFNMLIKKRSLRFDYDNAQEVLTMIRTEKMRPDLITYGVLSLGCKTKEEALALINEMKAEKYRLNAEILGAMLHQACYHNNFDYVLEIMEICIRDDIKPNKRFMTCLEEFKKKSKKISNDKSNPLSKSQSYQKGYSTFKARYKTWLQEINFEEEEVHPWQQYRQTVETNVKHYKDKEQSARFKPRHASRYRQKKSVK